MKTVFQREDAVEASNQAAAEAAKEIAVEKNTAPEKQPWELAFEKDHAAKLATETTEEQVKEDVKEVEDQVVQEDQETKEQPAETEEKPAEEQPSTEDAKPADEVEDKEQKPEEPLVTEETIKAFAQKHQVTEEQAKDELEGAQALLSKYQSPLELARAARSTQAAYDKLKATQVNQPAVIQDPTEEINQMVAVNRDKLLGEYKKQFPLKSQTMDDDIILEEIAAGYQQNYKNWVEEQKVVITKTAIAKRDELINSVAESDKRFLPEVKSMLSKLPDHQVAAQTFKFEDLLRWARGDKNTVAKLEKEAEQRGYERAMSSKKIVGELGRQAPVTKAPKKAQGESTGVTLNDWEKGQARQMFMNTTMTEAEMFASYTEIHKGRKK